jgi:hypothetical protein
LCDLKTFVDQIELKLAEIGPEDFVHNGRPCSSIHEIIWSNRRLNDLSRQLLAILGKERVDSLFRDHQPDDFPADGHLAMSLATLIPECCRVSNRKRISLDNERLLKGLRQLADCVKSGKVTYSFVLRITNIDIDTDFQLHDGIHFHKLSPSVIQSTFPINRQFAPLAPMFEECWLKHCVVATIPGCCTPADLQRCCSFECMEAIVNSILHTFLLAGVPAKGYPFVTHVLLDSPIDGHCLFRGNGGISSNPAKLTLDDVAALQRTYRFLKATENDRVLETAVDRFIRGKKRSEHHPNRINEPNWDKLVDYVIAMETLFLTTKGKSVDQELSYRFRLNGSSLVTEATGEDVRQAFCALRCLYELRSKVVHGSDDSHILKVANKFADELQIDYPHGQHSLGRLALVSKKVEEWLTKVLFHLDTMPIAERPYRKDNGWEEMLWKEKRDFPKAANETENEVGSICLAPGRTS